MLLSNYTFRQLRCDAHMQLISQLLTASLAVASCSPTNHGTLVKMIHLAAGQRPEKALVNNLHAQPSNLPMPMLMQSVNQSRVGADTFW